MSKRLTTATLEKLTPPKSGRLEIADSVSPGLTLRVTPSGSQTYVLRGRVKGQKAPVRLTIGDARRMELKDARAKADELRDKLRAGKDPRDEERAMWEQVVADFIDKHSKRRGNRTWAQTRAILDKKVTPHWGGKLITEISGQDVVALLNRLEDDGSVYQVNRALAAIRKLFNWSVTRGLVKVSPIPSGLARAGEAQRERVLGFDEITAVWRASEGLGPPFGPLIKLLLLTGQRRGETAAALWSGMDLEREHLWRLTATETKGKRDHLVPLSAAALAVVKAQPLIADPVAAEAARKAGKEAAAVYVFTTKGNAPLSGFSKAKLDLDAELKAAGVKLAPWRLHDLRRTVATYMEGALGIPFYIVGAVLNHAPAGYKGVTSRYTRDDLLYERRQALNAWARLLALIAAGGETWTHVEAILRPKTEEDRVRLVEFRRFIQGDEETWGRYADTLDQTPAGNVRELRPVVA